MSGADFNNFSVVTESVVTVGVTSGAVLSNKSGRQYALFMNDSDSVIYLSLSGTATLNSGIRLNANSGTYEITNLNMYTGAVSAISSGATKKLLVIEG